MVATNNSGTSYLKKSRPAKIRRSELQALADLLKSADTSLGKFGEAVSQYPVVLTHLLRAANSSLTGCATAITSPTHAALFLGERRVDFLLATLPKELVDDEMDGSAGNSVDLGQNQY